MGSSINISNSIYQVFQSNTNNLHKAVLFQITTTTTTKNNNNNDDDDDDDDDDWCFWHGN